MTEFLIGNFRRIVFVVMCAVFLSFIANLSVHALSPYSLTPSTNVPSENAAYLLTFTPSIEISQLGSIEFSMQSTFGWPTTIVTNDLQLTINDTEQSLQGALLGGFTLLQPSSHQITLTAPSGTSISVGSNVSLLIGRQGTFTNPSTESTHTFSITTRDSSGNLLESRSGIVLIQDTTIGMGSESPFISAPSGTASMLGLEEREEEEEEEEEEDEEEDVEEDIEDIGEEEEDIGEIEEDEAVVDIETIPTFDLDSDGVLDVADIILFLEMFESYPNPAADYNLDGFIDAIDFSLILTEWGESDTFDESFLAPLIGEYAGSSPYASRFKIASPRDYEPTYFRFEADDYGSDLFHVMPVSMRYVVRDDIVVLYILVDTGPSGIHVVDVTFSYNTELLSLHEAFKDDSIFSIWAKRVTEISPGIIRFVAGTPRAFFGSNGYVAAIEFEWKDNGFVEFLYQEETIGFAPNAVRLWLEFTDLFGWGEKPVAVFFEQDVPALELYSQSHPVEGDWYRSPEVFLSWDDVSLDEPGDLFWYTINQLPDIEIGDLDAVTKETSLQTDIPVDGRWFAHVARERDGKMSTISTYGLAIDRTPPLKFDVEASLIETINGARWMLTYHTQDETSGLRVYEIQHGSETVSTDKQLFVLPELSIGYFRYDVHAIDRAGNIRTASVNVITPGAKIARLLSGLMFILLLLLLLLLCALERRECKEHTKHIDCK